MQRSGPFRVFNEYLCQAPCHSSSRPGTFLLNAEDPGSRETIRHRGRTGLVPTRGLERHGGTQPLVVNQRKYRQVGVSCIISTIHGCVQVLVDDRSLVRRNVDDVFFNVTILSPKKWTIRRSKMHNGHDKVGPRLGPKGAKGFITGTRRQNNRRNNMKVAL